MNIKKLFTWETFWQIFRYGIITLASYIFIVVVIFLLKKINIDEKAAYAISLTIAYIGVYIGYNKFVFKTEHSAKVLKRFLVVLFASWIGNNLLFAFWTDALHINYAYSVALNTVVLGALRFIAQKFYVRK